jgi:tRNA(adenine34) deaminase
MVSIGRRSMHHSSAAKTAGNVAGPDPSSSPKPVQHDEPPPMIQPEAPKPRRRPSEAELKLWPYLRRDIAGCKFRRGEALGPYLVNFACADPRIVIEIDAGLDPASSADTDREQWLQAAGFQVLRLRSEDVLHNTAEVIDSIVAALPASAVPAMAQGEQRAEDERWMRHALGVARRAAQAGEVPVGAVLVGADGELISEGWNLPISLHDASAHAEMLALRGGGQKLGNYRLPGTTLYVTLEPCVMCAGAIIHARVSRLVFAARDAKAGAVESVYDLIARPRLNHRLQWRGGVLEAEAAELLREFFRERRQTR